MQTLGSRITSKTLAGLILLVPLAILFIAAIQIYELLEDMAAFAALELPFPPVINALIFILLGVLAAFAACLFTGLLMSTRPGRKFASFVEKGIADKIPLLGLLRNLTMSLTGSSNSQLKAAEINLYGDGACQFGFLMESLPDGRFVVFIPGAPAVTLGQTYIVPPERVKLLEVPITKVVNTITQWGTGAGDIYKPS
ncbi:MAG: hypothetical protein V7720_04620 [Halioglobus sp.]